MVSVSQGLTDKLTYTIYDPAQSFQDGPVFSQTYPLCPMECMLTTDFGVIFDPASIDMTFNSLLPAVNIVSNNFDFSNSVYDLAISCSSVRSTTGFGGDPSTETDFFSILYLSQCFSEPIQRAFKQSYTIDLYGEDARNFDSQAYVNPNCGPIIYELVLTEMTGVTVPSVFSLTSEGDIYVHPMVKENLGNYVLIIDACIEVGSGDNYEKICEASQPFTVTIIDPCL